MNRIILVALCVGLGVSTPVFAHEVDMNEKVKEFGRSVGNAYVCASKEDKAAFKEESELIYAMTLHELGPRAAYLYAVSVGFGASVNAGKVDCAKLAKHWTDMKVKLAMEEVE
jgi:hypothetical protein